jgi:hypothetical protein
MKIHNHLLERIMLRKRKKELERRKMIKIKMMMRMMIVRIC